MDLNLDHNEFDMLKSCLQDEIHSYFIKISAYEEGSDIFNMREIYKAFSNSIEDSDHTTNNNTTFDIETKDQNDFSEVYNSTMIIDDSENIINTTIMESGFQSTSKFYMNSTISSIESPEKIIVVAQVHHDLSFNPPNTPSRSCTKNSDKNFSLHNCYTRQREVTDKNEADVLFQTKFNEVTRTNDSGMDFLSFDHIEKYY